MKIQLYLLLIMSASIFFACSDEEVLENSQTTDLKIELNEREQVPFEWPCRTLVCDYTYSFRTASPNLPNFKTIEVTYNASSTPADKYCIRFDYFICFNQIYMSTIQDDNYLTDNWLVPVDPPDPDGDVVLTGCDDPRITIPCDD